MRYAASTAELQSLIRSWPGELPSAFLPDDGPAAYYYDTCSLRELRSFLNGDPDMDVCGRYGVTSGEWREAVEMAMVARIVVQQRRKKQV